MVAPTSHAMKMDATAMAQATAILIMIVQNIPSHSHSVKSNLIRLGHVTLQQLFKLVQDRALPAVDGNESAVLARRHNQ